MTWIADVGAVAVVVAPVVGLQTFWIARGLDDVGRRIDRVGERIAHIDETVLREHGERIARLEAR